MLFEETIGRSKEIGVQLVGDEEIYKLPVKWKTPTAHLPSKGDPHHILELVEVLKAMLPTVSDFILILSYQDLVLS